MIARAVDIAAPDPAAEKAIRLARLGSAIRFCVFAQIWRDSNDYAWAKDAWNAGFRSLGALATLYERKYWQRLATMINSFRYVA